MQRESSSSAKKILEAFKVGKVFLCLRDLAKASGFPRASDRDFKDGFNYLLSKGVVKLQQSGWRSEKRGTKNHPKTVILTADIYDVETPYIELDMDKLSDLDGSVTIGLELTTLNITTLPERKKERYRKCKDCLERPLVYITSERIGVCEKHWRLLADSDIEW